MRRSKRTDYHIVDMETGKICNASEVKVDWDGSIREVAQCDGKHPHYLEKRYPEPLEPSLINYPGRDRVWGTPYVSAVATLTAYGATERYTICLDTTAASDAFNPPRQRG
jgi:hypothetical protein